MTRPKLLALDMDGTLLNTQKQVTPRTIDALRRLDEHGFHATVATGRAYPMARPSFGQAKTVVRFAVMGNGSHIMDLWEDKTLDVTLIPDEGIEQAVEVGLENDCVFNFFTTEKSYFNAEEAPLLEKSGLSQYGPLWIDISEPIGDPLAFVRSHRGQIVKLNLNLPGTGALERTRAALAEAPIHLADSEGTSFEVTAPGVRKDTGIARLCDILGYTMEEVVAVGDGDNDPEMLRAAGIGVAMANGTPAAKAAADTVTRNDCDHDGIAEVIGRFFLNGA